MPMTRPTDLRVTLWMAYLAQGALFLVVDAALETGALAQSLLNHVIGGSPIGVAPLEPGPG